MLGGNEKGSWRIQIAGCQKPSQFTGHGNGPRSADSTVFAVCARVEFPERNCCSGSGPPGPTGQSGGPFSLRSAGTVVGQTMGKMKIVPLCRRSRIPYGIRSKAAGRADCRLVCGAFYSGIPGTVGML